MKKKYTHRFYEESIKIKDFYRFKDQIIEVPFKLFDEIKKVEYDMNFKAGFVGCDKNENNEVFPFQGW